MNLSEMCMHYARRMVAKNVGKSNYTIDQLAEEYIDRFEAIADLYYRDTGYLRPGKDEPRETGRDSSSDENGSKCISFTS